MSFPPIYNPAIPYLGLIPGGMCPGKMIRINGNIPMHAQRFAVNIQCGPGVNPRDDMALHLNVRIPENCVVRNHLQGMSWGNEDISGGLPLQLGQPFQILILCEPNMFKIALNGNHFCEFIHRLPYQRASHITIDGDVTVSMIGFEGGDISFQQAPPPYSAPTGPMGAQSYGSVVPPMGGPAYGAPPYGQQQPPQQPFDARYNNMAPVSAMPMAGYQPQVTPYQTAPGTFGNNPYAAPGVQYKKEESSFGKKALMYGLPLAGVGLGAYALGGGFSRSSSDESDNDWLE